MNAQGHQVGQYLRRIRHGGIVESCLGVRSIGRDPSSVFRNFPADADQVVAQLVMGGCGFRDAAQAVTGKIRWPVMWVQGDACDGKDLSGFQALLLTGAAVRRLELDGTVVGSAWSDADADYCWLAGIIPADLRASREAQARQVFERIEAVLQQAGLDFPDLVRTWLYLDRLLDWYDGFNAVRTSFFQERGVFEKRVPASTGIGACNPQGAALSAGAIAVRPKHAGLQIRALPSPLQCPALNYQSSFSRAMELEFPDRRQLIISGTASIAQSGESRHCNDVAGQIDLTMQVVNAILESRAMTWRDTTRAIAYFRDMKSAPLLADYCRAQGIADFPVLNAHATVCRHDLLFEIELDAAVSTADATSITSG